MSENNLLAGAQTFLGMPSDTVPPQMADAPQFRPGTDDFTDEEQTRRRAGMQAAAQVLFRTDISKLDDDAVGGLYRASAKALFGIEDPDGTVAFGRKRAGDARHNVELLRQFCKGDYSLIRDPEYDAWRAMDEEQKFRHALENESKSAKVKGNLEGKRGASLWEMLALAGTSGAPDSMLPPHIRADIQRRMDYDKLTPEEQEVYRRDVIGRYDRKIAKEQVLATYLAAKEGMSDRAAELLANSYNRGEVDVDAVEALSDEDKDRFYTALSVMRGDQKKGHLLGVPTDFTDDTAVNRGQLALYGLQQSVLGLVSGTWEAGSSYAKLAYAKTLLDDQARKDYFRRWNAEARAKAALEQGLPEADSWMGEMVQALGENSHWLIPQLAIVKGGKIVGASVGKANALLKASRAAKGAADLEKGMVNLWARQFASMERFTDALRDAAKAVRAVDKGKTARGAALWAAGEASSFSAFANEFISNCDAAGVSREESVPMSAIVGLVNAKIESLYVPGMEHSLTPAQVKNLMMMSGLRALKSDGAAGFLKWLGNYVEKGLVEGAKVTLTEGPLEEPLQQFAQEWGKEIAQSAEELKKSGRGELGLALGKFIYDNFAADGGFEKFAQKNLETYVETAVDMIPPSVGFGITANGRQKLAQHRRNRAVRKMNMARWRADVAAAEAAGREAPPAPLMLGLDEQNRMTFNPNGVDYDEGVVDLVQREIDTRRLVGDYWEGRGETEAGPGEDNRYVQAMTEARRIWRSGRGDKVNRIAEAAGVDHTTAEVIAQYLQTEQEVAAFSPRVREYVGLAVSAADFSEETIRTVLPGYVDGSFMADDEKGVYTAKVKLGDGSERTIAYKVGDLSDELKKMIPENERADSAFGMSYDAQLRRGSDRGATPWAQLSDAERHKIATDAALGTYGMTEGSGGVFQMTDAKGDTVTVNADEIVRLSNGKLADIGYTALATMGTARHETFHALWRFASSSYTDEQLQETAKALGLDVTSDTWRVDLDEEMAHQMEEYASGHYVSHIAETRIEKLLESGAGWFVRLFGRLGLGDEVKNAKTGRSFTLKDFYDAVLRGEIGSGELGVRHTATEAAAPKAEKGKAEKGKAAKSGVPVAVTDEERAQEAQDQAQAAAATQTEQAEQPPAPAAAPKAEYTLENPADATVPDARFYRVQAGDGVDIVGELVVSDANELKTSYKGTLEDGTLQNRAETEEGRALVEKIAGNPDPLQVGTVQPRANNGFIWATPSGNVFIGNTRETGITQAYARGNAENVRAYMLNEAKKRGLEIPAGVENPIVHFVLREIRSKDGTAAIQDVVRLTNESVNRGMNVYEQAKNDADVMLKEKLVPGIVLRADGRIDTERSAAAIGAFRRLTNAQGMIDADTGLLTEEGQTRLSNAVLAAFLASEDPTLTQKLIRDAGRLDMENERRALMRSAADLMALAVQKPQYDLRGPIAEALRYFTEWREADEAKRAEAGKTRRDWYARTKDGQRRRGIAWQEHMAQQDMFRRPSPAALIIGDLLAASRDLRSFEADDRETEAGKTRAQELVSRYLADFAQNARSANTETDDLFGAPPATVEEMLKAQRTKGETGARFSMSVNPKLGEDIREAVNTDKNTMSVVSGHKEVVFASHAPEVLIASGIPDGRIYTHAFILRKMKDDHDLDEVAIENLVSSAQSPAAILHDVDKKKGTEAFIILTDQTAKDLNGRVAPVMIYLRPDSNGNYIASAYARTEKGEKHYIGLLNSGSLLAINKSKVAGLNLTGEAKSSFESVRTDDNVVDLERFTKQIISNSLSENNGTSAELVEAMGRKAVDSYGKAVKDGQRRFAVKAMDAAEYREVYDRYHNADGSTKPGWLKAPNGKDTKLDPVQWVQVRTPSFMRWFGDWMAAAEMAPSSMDDAKVNFKRLMASKAELRTADGNVLRFASQSAKAYSKAAEVESANRQAHWCAIANIEQLVVRSRFMYEEKPRNGSSDILSYVKYGCVFTFGGDRYLAKITSKKYPGREQQNFYTVESVSVKKIVARGIHEAISKGQPLDANDESRIAHILEGVNADSSKIVDENGEPLVVYHNSKKWQPLHEPIGKAVFKDGPNFFGSSKELYDELSQFGIMGMHPEQNTAYFINVRNPLIIDAKGGAWNNIEGVTTDDIAWREYDKGIHDGVIIKNVSEFQQHEWRTLLNDDEVLMDDIIPFSPTQIKSATDNTGAFDAANPDIRFSVRRVTPEEDAAYMDAVRSGDMEAARTLLKAAWERSGYSPDTSYKDAHAAPSAPVEAKDFKNVDALEEARDEGWDLNLWAIAKGITGQPDDFFGERGPSLYGYDDAAGRETQLAIAQAIADIRGGNDKTRVIVYRAVPKDVKFDGLQSGGQWVSPSKTYVENHGKSRFGYGEYRIVRQVVRAENLWWDGNDAREWGYDDGLQYVYLNAENGMKLATVTYDDAGNVIPLSQRFNQLKSDTRFSIAGARGASAIGVRGVADAEAMEKDGRDRTEIWRRTGWWRGADGKWRFELPPVRMKGEAEVMSALLDGGNESTLGKLLDAPELFKAYPQLEDTKIVLLPKEVQPGEPGGWYDRLKNEIVLFDAGTVSLKDMPEKERGLRDHYERILKSDEYLNRAFAKMGELGIEHGTVEEEREYARRWIERQKNIINRTNETRIRDLVNDRRAKSVFGKIVHEVQHAVQRIEGFARGASGEDYGYRRFAGEVEARNAARRDAMPPEERAATPPWETEDVPADSQIMRFSIANLYTGSAADYEKPSIHYIGTGEGAQVYGWGLYASNRRGIAEYYAKKDKRDKLFGKTYGGVIGFGGYQYNEPLARTVEYYGEDPMPESVGRWLEVKGNPDLDIVLEEFEESVMDESDDPENDLANDSDYQWLKAHKNEVKVILPEVHENLYEQTFFTNRAEGDESHLLSWYEPVSEENLERILEGLKKEGVSDRFKDMYWLRYKGMSSYLESNDIRGAILDKGSTGDAVYQQLTSILGGPKAASEFLARADIDGVKYPVDSYGKQVKDGDEAGWNYVSFRDENIRVDHKWVDGQKRFSAKFGADLSVQENANRLREHFKNLAPAKSPGYLRSGEPKDVMEWYMANMVGKTWEFDIPGVGLRNFRPAPGHIGKLVCHGGLHPDKTKVNKGRILKDIKTKDWVKSVLDGEVSGADVDGWDYRRAKNILRIPALLDSFDAVVYEDARKREDGTLQNPSLVFIKKFEGSGGEQNMLAMTIVPGSNVIGPITNHVKGFTNAWMKNKKLVLTEEGELWNSDKNNSALLARQSGDNAEGNSPERVGIVPQSEEKGNGLNRMFSVALREAIDRRAYERPSGGAKPKAKARRTPRTARRLSYAFPRLDQMSGDQLVATAVATQMALGKSDKVSDRSVKITTVQKLIKGIHPEWSTHQVGVEALRVATEAQKMARKIREDLDRGVSDSLVLRHLPDAVREQFGQEMTQQARQGARLGAYHQRAMSAVEDKQAKVIEEAVKVQSGIETKLLENAYGVDLSQTLMNLVSNPFLKKDANGLYVPAGGGEQAAQDQGEIVQEDAPEKEVSEKARRAVDEVVAKSAEARAAEKANEQEAERMRGRDQENAAGSGGEEDASLEGADIVDIATRKQGLNLEDPRQLAHFVAELARRYWVDTHGLAKDANAWADSVAVQFLRKTAANVYNKLAQEIAYSQARDVAARSIDGFANIPTVQGLISEMTYVGQVINARKIRETQQQLCERLDLFLREKMGAQGRFKPDNEELHRKVSAEIELRARYMRHAMWLTPDAASEEAKKLLHEIEVAAVDFKAEGHDIDQARVTVENLRKLNVLREFGSLRYKPVAQIEAAIQYWEDLERGSGDEIARENLDREIRTKKAAAILAKAFHNPSRKYAREGKGVRDMLSDYLSSHMGFMNLLRDMTRYASKEDAAEAETVFRWLELEIQKAGTKTEVEKRRHAEALAAAVNSIYGRDFAKVLKEFAKEDARFAPFMGTVDGHPVTPTKGRAIQLMVSLLQEGRIVGQKDDPDHPGKLIDVWEGGYHDNIVKHGRENQAAKIAKLLTPADMNLVKWLGQWYEANRQELSQVCDSLFGIGVYAETSNYFPVKMLLEKQGLEKGEAVGWSIFPRALTPRVRNERDFDTSADVLQMFMSRMEEAAQWKAHAQLGLEMRGIFGRSELQAAITANHGNKVNQTVLGFVTDTLAGKGTVDRGDNGATYYTDMVRGWAALGALSLNVGVMFKQTTSIPAFGFEIGLRKTASHMVTAFTPEGWDAMCKIFYSDERKVRWNTGNTEEVKNALAAGDTNWFMKQWRRGMITNRLGDCVPALVIGQGIYREALENGMSEEDAMAYTWMLVERTQQSGRIENQAQFMRRSKYGRAIYQFLSTQQQYLQYEVRALRGVMAKPGDLGKWRVLARAAVLNHFILSSAYFWMGALYRRAFGDEPPEDELKDWVVSMLLGPYGALYGLGLTCTTAMNEWVKGFVYGKGSSAVPALSFVGNIIIRDPAAIVLTALDETKTWDDVLEKMGRFGADANALFRDFRKLKKNYLDD